MNALSGGHMNRLLQCPVWPSVICLSSCGVRLMPVAYPCVENGRYWPSSNYRQHEQLLEAEEASVEITEVAVEREDQSCRAFVSVEFLHADQATDTPGTGAIGKATAALYEKTMMAWLRNLASENACRSLDVRVNERSVSRSGGSSRALFSDLKLQEGADARLLRMDACQSSDQGHMWQKIASRQDGKVRNQ